jgi:hypothetical protein
MQQRTKLCSVVHRRDEMRWAPVSELILSAGHRERLTENCHEVTKKRQNKRDNRNKCQFIQKRSLPNIVSEQRLGLYFELNGRTRFWTWRNFFSLLNLLLHEYRKKPVPSQIFDAKTWNKSRIKEQKSRKLRVKIILFSFELSIMKLVLSS